MRYDGTPLSMGVFWLRVLTRPDAVLAPGIGGC